jgi:hypothetical protein
MPRRDGEFSTPGSVVGPPVRVAAALSGLGPVGDAASEHRHTDEDAQHDRYSRFHEERLEADRERDGHQDPESKTVKDRLWLWRIVHRRTSLDAETRRERASNRQRRSGFRLIWPRGIHAPQE